ncbi:hypothetical protein F5148DRAFT_1214459, partial [Russula earlei]
MSASAAAASPMVLLLLLRWCVEAKFVFGFGAFLTEGRQQWATWGQWQTVGTEQWGLTWRPGQWMRLRAWWWQLTEPCLRRWVALRCQW